jgi:hypothetical protein
MGEQIQADKRSSELYDLANSILTDCKRNAHLSDLDSIICTLHESSALPPPRHPHGSDLLNHLARALVTRFWYTGQPRDLDEAIVRCCEALILHHNIRESELMASQPYVRYYILSRMFWPLIQHSRRAIQSLCGMRQSKVRI